MNNRATSLFNALVTVMLTAGLGVTLATPAAAQFQQQDGDEEGSESVRLALPSLDSFAWEPGTELRYAIRNDAGQRMGTAYYRVKQAPEEFGSGMWQLRYSAQGEGLSESSVVIFHPDRLIPVKTTRKIVRGESETLWTMRYGSGGVEVTRSGDNGSQSQNIPHQGPVYDYEQLMFLMPLVQNDPGTRHYLPVYHSGDSGLIMTYWGNQGEELVTAGDRTWEARKLRVRLGSVTQYIWIAQVNGQTQVVKYDTGVGTVFEALSIPSNTDKTPESGEVSPPGGEEEFPDITVTDPDEAGEESEQGYELTPEGARPVESEDGEQEAQAPELPEPEASEGAPDQSGEVEAVPMQLGPPRVLMPGSSTSPPENTAGADAGSEIFAQSDSAGDTGEGKAAGEAESDDSGFPQVGPLPRLLR